MPHEPIYTLRVLSGGAVEITHSATRTMIAVCPNASIAGKVATALALADMAEPIQWTPASRNVLGLAGRRHDENHNKTYKPE